MTEQQSSYRQIMKATSIFGGVQVFNIIISIVRSKFVAVLLGPAGMGIMGLLTSTIGIISSLTNFGLGTSAVKDIAAAFGSNDEKRIGLIIGVFRRLVWITGLLGLTTTALLSSWLSQLTFGNNDYTLAFIWISVTLLLNQLSSGQLAVLQGLRKLNYLAKANLSGSFTGLFITLPLYYFLGFDGIVPGIIGTALLSLLMSWYFSGKVKVEKTNIPNSKTFSEGKNMLRMGFLISLSGFLTIGASYIVRIFISRTGDLEQVGLYNAGFAIINTYVSLVFTAMVTDYYPRLSAVANDNKRCKQIINQQAEIAILILAPILILFLVFIKWVIIILYSKQFIPVNSMIQWVALGMFFKAASWSVAFILLAKGTTKLFFWSELINNAYTLGLSLLGYHFWGLTGIGYAFVSAYLLYLFQLAWMTNIKFKFKFDNSFKTIFVVQFGLACAGFLTMRNFDQPYNYIAGGIAFVFSSIYSTIELDKRLGLLGILKKYTSR
jgi:O-antigen/teichoic acid export membrane protein